MTADISKTSLFGTVSKSLALTRLPTSSGHSNLNLTPEEKRVYGQLFQQADTEGLAVVTGDVAVKFFERTQLDPTTLGAVRSETPIRRLVSATLTSRDRSGKSRTQKTEDSLHRQGSVLYYA